LLFPKIKKWLIQVLLPIIKKRGNMKAYKIELLILDFDNVGQEEICSILENTKYPNWCISPSVKKVTEKEIEWGDNHPLNKKETANEAYEKLFNQ
jgi:hypothetical protein